MNTAINNFLVYEDGNKYLGIATVTMPTLTRKTVTSNGSGIAGDIVIPITGHNEASEITINFSDSTPAAYTLAEQRVHKLTFKVAHERLDSTEAWLKYFGDTYYMEVVPASENGGTLAPAAQQGVSGTYHLYVYKHWHDGELVRDWEPLNFVDKDSSGVDRLAEIRSLLGE